MMEKCVRINIYLLLELEWLTTGDAGTGQMVGGGRLRGVLQDTHYI